MREYRVSALIWRPGSPNPHKMERVTEDEDSARSQYEGLLAMEAPHDVRPCGKHVWSPRLEVRNTAGWEQDPPPDPPEQWTCGLPVCQPRDPDDTEPCLVCGRLDGFGEVSDD